LNRENNFHHHQYDEEMLMYECLKEGNPEAVEKSIGLFSSSRTGHLSNDPLRNVKYLFVASTTLATRFAMEGGLDSETAYNISDLYIQNMDKCTNISQVNDLQKEMMLFFTSEVAKLSRKRVYSKPVLQCMNYIDMHLNEPLTLDVLARQVQHNPNYLSLLFKKELKITLTEYIRSRRVEAAKNMLLYSDYSYSRISNCLAFSSQSYFIRIFRESTGYTPRDFRNRFYLSTFEKQHEKTLPK
jgi:YesN/AraC family two-component response regulator